MTGFDETVPPHDDPQTDATAQPDDDEKGRPQIQPEIPDRDNKATDGQDIEDPEIRSGHIGTDDAMPRGQWGPVSDYGQG